MAPLPMVSVANVPESAPAAPARQAPADPEPALAATAVQPVPEAVTRSISTRSTPRTPRAAASGLTDAVAGARALGDALVRAAAPRARAQAPVRSRRVAAEPTSRLKLEPAAPAATRQVADGDNNQIIEEAIQAVAQAASAARAIVCQGPRK
jgi:hypothetical protein